MNLDQRQRAMLGEMGVRLWQPWPAASPEPEHSAVGADPRVHKERLEPAASPLPQADPAALTSAPDQARPAAAAPGLLPAGSQQGVTPGGWSLGPLHELYAAQAPAQAPAGCWLLLIETPAAAAAAGPLSGDAGQLLDNMLRAAHRHREGRTCAAPLIRQAGGGEAGALSAALAALMVQVRPDVVLLMGRLAAQAVLQSGEPFGKLRGRVHRLHGAATVVSYDAGYLLRSLADKAKAWDDLCLALQADSAVAKAVDQAV